MTTPTNPPTCREALQQIVETVTKTGSFLSEWPPDRISLDAARAALAAPGRVAVLPPDVREALQCVKDWGPMSCVEWRRKWAPDNPRGENWILADKASAVLAKYPETAPVPPLLTREGDGPVRLADSEMAAERAAWIRERDELIAERDRFEAEAERHATDKGRLGAKLADANLLNSTLRDGLDRASAATATWRGRAEWLLSELRKEES